MNQVEVTVEVKAKEAHGNSVIIEENIGMKTNLPPPSLLDLWDSFITLIGNGQRSRYKILSFLRQKVQIEERAGQKHRSYNGEALRV